MANNYYRTAMLDNEKTWDLTLDANNNLAVATDKYAIAQDVASSCLIFKTEVVYDKARGVDWKNIVGKNLSQGFIVNQIKQQANKVDSVIDAVVHLNFDRTIRTLYGVIVCEDVFGNSIIVNL